MQAPSNAHSSELAETTAAQLYLASESPRRRALLATIGVAFDRITAPVDESVLANETPAQYVQRLAVAKAKAGQHALAASAPKLPVLGSDTAVVIDNEILGKPADRAAGLAMLGRLAGREHEVFTAVALVSNDRDSVRLNISHVRIRPLSDAELATYWETGEPADKAGGYGIQGLGAVFVTEIRGSHSGVMGLPLFETAELLKQFGVDIWRPS